MSGYIIGGLLLGLCLIVVILQLKGKPFIVRIEHKVDQPVIQEAIIPDIEKANEEARKNAKNFDDIIQAVNEVMIGGERNVEE